MRKWKSWKFEPLWIYFWWARVTSVWFQKLQSLAPWAQCGTVIPGRTRSSGVQSKHSLSSKALISTFHPLPPPHKHHEDQKWGWAVWPPLPDQQSFLCQSSPGAGFTQNLVKRRWPVFVHCLTLAMLLFPSFIQHPCLSEFIRKVTLSGFHCPGGSSWFCTSQTPHSIPSAYFLWIKRTG